MTKCRLGSKPTSLVRRNLMTDEQKKRGRICPGCNGQGSLWIQGRRQHCHPCDGTGKITPENEWRL